MAFVNPTAPNLPDFITFCQAQGVSAAVLAPSSEYFSWALTQSQDTVLYVPAIPSVIYVMAVYNLGLHSLIELAEDQVGLGLTELTWAAGLVTATTSEALGFSAGETFPVVIVGAAPAGYNGCFFATATGSNTFTYPMEDSPGTATSPGMFNMSFFANLRKQFNLLSLVAGVVQTTFDNGSGTTLAVPDFFKDLTFSDLDVMKTPWGRKYLAYAQKAGPTVVGVS